MILEELERLLETIKENNKTNPSISGITEWIAGELGKIIRRYEDDCK